MKQEIETWDGITCYRLSMTFLVSECLKTQEMSNKAVCMDPYSLEFVPDHFKTEEMCKKAVCRKPYTLRYVSDHLKTKEMCDEAVRIVFLDQYKAKGARNEAVSLITLRHKGCAYESFYDRFKTEGIFTYSHIVEKN